MNYDNYKLSLEDNEPYVSQCCGGEYWDSSEWEETEYDYICDICDKGCNIILDYEYQQVRAEQIADEMYEENKLNN